MRKIKGLIFGLFLAFLFLWPTVLPAAVISIEQRDLYAVYFLGPEFSGTSLPYVLTKFGPGNINLLERIDIVLDQEGRVAGIELVYTPPNGLRRHVFLRNVSGWVFEEVRPGAKGKRVTIRLITSEDLNRLD